MIGTTGFELVRVLVEFYIRTDRRTLVSDTPLHMGKYTPTDAPPHTPGSKHTEAGCYGPVHFVQHYGQQHLCSSP